MKKVLYVSASSQSLRFIFFSLRLYSSFITSRSGHNVCSEYAEDNLHAGFEIFVLFVWFDVYTPVNN